MALALILGLFGLIIGSFLNVVILRHGARAVNGRSGCMSCGRELLWYDMIPVFSWIFLGGRCRFCKSRISAQYPLVEASTGILFALIGGISAPIGIPLQLLSCAIAALLVIIAAYDLRHTIIPDEWAYAFAALALMFAFFSAGAITGTGEVFIILFSGVVAALPLLALWVVSRGAWMGLGDVKLALGIGWLLGMYAGLFAVMFAFIIGAVVSVCILLPLPKIMRILRITSLGNTGAGYTMKSEVAFGPFLIVSCLLLWFLQLYGVSLPFAFFGL